MAEISVQLQLQDKYKTVLTVSITFLQRSTLLKGILEDFPGGIKNPIFLEKITNLTNFQILLEFMETGLISQDFSDKSKFVKFIQDAVYLGLDDLLNHFVDVMKKTLDDTTWDQIDLKYVPYDFFYAFLNSSSTKTQSNRSTNTNLFFLILKWGKHYNLQDKEIIKLLKIQSIDSLEFESVQQFRKQYPSIFNLLIPATTIMDCYIKDLQCQYCNRRFNQQLQRGNHYYGQNYQHKQIVLPIFSNTINDEIIEMESDASLI
eukprot:TRINITY_DN18060_c1_g2_i6.p1 TRINITY_DN18060_c1_g2~~TRINITY_DN18060_c1_g2_i6.p1  ORF type:complete len:288 (-),score=9.60 TRINITY_DN18060_c1_g2_i6:472-1254(-)